MFVFITFAILNVELLCIDFKSAGIILIENQPPFTPSPHNRQESIGRKYIKTLARDRS
jgi:hypothetical protein